MLHTIEEIKVAVKKAGGHWFDPKSLRFFRSHVYSPAIPIPSGALFVSSEQYVSVRGEKGPRRYSVRFCNDNGEINTVGDFQQYPTRRSAFKAAQTTAEEMIANPDNLKGGWLSGGDILGAEGGGTRPEHR